MDFASLKGICWQAHVTASGQSFRYKYGRVSTMRTVYAACSLHEMWMTADASHRRNLGRSHWWLYNLQTRDSQRIFYLDYSLCLTGQFRRRSSSSTVMDCSSASAPCLRTLTVVVALPYRRYLVQRF